MIVKTKPIKKKVYFAVKKRNMFFYKMNTPSNDMVVDSTNLTFTTFTADVQDKYELEREIKDTDGIKYVKFANQNLFVEKSDIVIIN